MKDHPNIVRYHEFFQMPDDSVNQFYVRESVSSDQTLQDLINKSFGTDRPLN